MYMATARVFTAPDQPININQQGQANPSAVQISDDQNVKFSNHSGSTISIVFAQTAISHKRVFNDIDDLPTGTNHSEGPLVSGPDCRVNLVTLKAIKARRKGAEHLQGSPERFRSEER